MTTYTADLCDDYPEATQLLGPGYQNYGGAASCEGEIVTIRLDRNNSDLITLLRDENGAGKVVIVDADQAYFAVVGENLMKFAAASGYTGIIVNGYIRDTAQIVDIPVALYALGTCSRKHSPVTSAERGVDLGFGGVVFRQGEYAYGDTDGVVVAANRLS